MKNDDEPIGDTEPVELRTLREILGAYAKQVLHWHELDDDEDAEGGGEGISSDARTRQSSDSLHGAFPTDRTIRCSKPLDVARAWARALTTPRGAAGAASMRHRWRGVSLAVGTVRHCRRLPEMLGDCLGYVGV